MSQVTLSLISYCTSGGLFLICSLLLIKLYRSQLFPVSLVLASVIEMGWSFALAWSEITPLSNTAIVFLEFARYAGWILGILFTLHFFTGLSLTRAVKLTIVFFIFTFLVVNAFIIPYFYAAATKAGLNYQLIWSGIFLSICGIVCIEQVYRNISTTMRLAFKVFCLSLGTLFFYDLYLFADGLIYKTIDTNLWAARGIINSLAAILVIYAITRPKSKPVISISRAIAFYTTSLTLAGLFLFFIAVGSYYISHYGGSWGRLIQITLLVCGGGLIVAYFGSNRIRDQVRVWVNKNFFSHKYDYRTEWLKLIKILSEPARAGGFYEISIRAVAEIFKSPAGCLWLKTDKTYEPAGSFNMVIPRGATEDIDSLFVQQLRTEWVFDEATVTSNELRYQMPAWAKKIPYVWLILPLLNENDLIGFMLLKKSNPTLIEPLSWEDLDLLKTIGRQIASYLEAHLSTTQLTQSKQFDTYHQLTAFIIHDLKNLIAQQQLVVKNAVKHKENPAFIDDAIKTIENSVQRMSNLLQKMQSREPSEGKVIPLQQVLKEAVIKCQNMVPLPTLRTNDQPIHVKADKDHLVMVFAHIIKNAQEATPPTGFVDISLYEVDGSAILAIEDNGIGMNQAFINTHLFQPFVTTKTGKGMGIGAYQAREFIRSLGGDVTVISEPNVGTTFSIKLPACTKEPV